MNMQDYTIFTRTTAIYPNQTPEQTLAYLGLGLAGEAGEVAEKIKKRIRDGKWDLEEVVKEMGDVVWYLTRMADEMQIPWNVIVQRNVEKLSSRKDRDKLGGEGDNR